MGQEGTAGSWQPLAKGCGEWLPQEARAGTQGAVGSQARLAQPWAGASPAQQERGEMRFGPQNHAGGKEGEWRKPWNVSGPCGRFLVPSLCQGRGRGALGSP